MSDIALAAHVEADDEAGISERQQPDACWQWKSERDSEERRCGEKTSPTSDILDVYIKQCHRVWYKLAFT